jgi:hypothetical protein
LQRLSICRNNNKLSLEGVLALDSMQVRDAASAMAHSGQKLEEKKDKPSIFFESYDVEKMLLL